MILFNAPAKFVNANKAILFAVYFNCVCIWKMCILYEHSIETLSAILIFWVHRKVVNVPKWPVLHIHLMEGKKTMSLLILFGRDEQVTHKKKRRKMT